MLPWRLGLTLLFTTAALAQTSIASTDKDPDANALRQQIQTAYRNLHGLKLRAKTNGADLRISLTRPNQMRLRVTLNASRDASKASTTDYLINEKFLTTVNRRPDVTIDRQTRVPHPTTKVTYSKSPIDPTSKIGLARQLNFPFLVDIIGLWEGIHGDLAPSINAAALTRLTNPIEVQRLRPQTSAGCKLDGIRIRQLGGPKPLRPDTPVELTYWFDAKSHLLRRQQFYPLPRLVNGRLERQTLQTIIYSEVQINPKFAPDEFQLPQPEGSMKVGG